MLFDEDKCYNETCLPCGQWRKSWWICSGNPTHSFRRGHGRRPWHREGRTKLNNVWSRAFECSVKTRVIGLSPPSATLFKQSRSCGPGIHTISCNKPWNMRCWSVVVFTFVLGPLLRDGLDAKIIKPSNIIHVASWRTTCMQGVPPFKLPWILRPSNFSAKWKWDHL